MIDLIKKNVLRFVIIVLLQGYLLKYIKVTNLEITPFLYLLFIILLPYGTSGWLLLSLAFAEGLLIDFLLDTYGEHTAALLLMTFIRPLYLRILANKENYTSSLELSIQNFGFVWFLKYALGMVLIHHIAYYMLEAFQFSYFHITSLKIIFTTLFTIIIIVIVQFLFFKEKSNQTNS